MTFEQIESKVRDLADQQPDYVYDRGSHRDCQYNADGTQPGCIFGQALAAFDLEVPEDMEGTPIADLIGWLGINTSVLQRIWMRRVQSSQDTGHPWRETIEKVDAKLAGLLGQ
ncbi:hypothetical protein [Actinomadura oligospora]|uniref:hypothetical protein n=1 Tax=Actinomadura oligospora TaxID=111804 RepID=UPI0012F98A1D|nr:hypothetical protein [Actinomadura oligospora]